jgi:hypothetical protein
MPSCDVIRRLTLTTAVFVVSKKKSYSYERSCDGASEMNETYRAPSWFNSYAHYGESNYLSVVECGYRDGGWHSRSSIVVRLPIRPLYYVPGDTSVENWWSDDGRKPKCLEISHSQSRSVRHKFYGDHVCNEPGSPRREAGEGTARYFMTRPSGSHPLLRYIWSWSLWRLQTQKPTSAHLKHMRRFSQRTIYLVVSVLLAWCRVAGNFFPTFRDHYVVSQRR